MFIPNQHTRLNIKQVFPLELAPEKKGSHYIQFQQVLDHGVLFQSLHLEKYRVAFGEGQICLKQLELLLTPDAYHDHLQSLSFFFFLRVKNSS